LMLVTLRYIYQHDVVAHLPPRNAGAFAHFGPEYRFDGSWPWRPRTQPTQLDRFRNVRFKYSLDDHAPQHYISRLTPPGTATEFGDYQLAD
jgi:hypothetical protein